MTPDNYTGILKQILSRLDILDQEQNEIKRMVSEIYKLDMEDMEEDIMQPRNEPEVWNNYGQQYDEETIKRLGVRVPYNKIEDPQDVTRFKEFIYKAKSSYKTLSPDELKWISAADKNFDDIRLSDKHISLLQDIYPKIYGGKQWPFRSKPGYMFKYPNIATGQIAWDWFGE